MVTRLSISVEDELLRRFDGLIEQEGYSNRSEALRDLIRAALVQQEWKQQTGEMAGVAVLVYDHHRPELPQTLADIQHQEHGLVVSTLHVHLDRHNCLEVVVLRGQAQRIKRIASSLISTRGVKHGSFFPTTTGRNLP